MVMKPRDRIDYSAMADREPLKLPDGNRVAVWIIVNIENWDVEKPMARTVLPPPGGQVRWQVGGFAPIIDAQNLEPGVRRQ